MFRKKSVHRHRLDITSTGRSAREVLQTRNSLWVNGMITAEVTERSPLPPGCSVTLAGGSIFGPPAFSPEVRGEMTGPSYTPSLWCIVSAELCRKAGPGCIGAG
jgi:hypothetical protein